MKELQKMSEVELLQAHSAIIVELQRRGVAKTKNNPIGDYTEWLVCNRLQLQIQRNSRQGFDAIDRQHVRYQIKARRSEENSVRFSPIRKFEERMFDFLIAVIYHDDYSVRLAVKIPHGSIPKLARYQRHVNGFVPVLTDKAVKQVGLSDISRLLS